MTNESAITLESTIELTVNRQEQGMPDTQTTTDIRRRIIELAAETAGVDPDQVSQSSRLREDLEFDSLDIVEFTMAVEDEFDLNIPDESANDVATVGQAVDLVIAHLKLSASAE